MIRRALLAIPFILSGLCSAIGQQAGITPCGTVVSLSVTNASANTQLSNCGGTLIVMNITTQEAFFMVGTASTTAATTSGWSLPGNTFITLNVPRSAYIAAITASSTTTLRLIQGNAQ